MSTALSINRGDRFGLPVGVGCFEWRQTAVSSESWVVTHDTRKIGQTLEHSQALFGTKAEVISELSSLADECGEGNWDGEGAYALEPWAVRTAARFIRVLPEDVPMPEVSPEPDGTVALDWAVASNRVFSVSFGNNLRLAYADRKSVV